MHTAQFLKRIVSAALIVALFPLPAVYAQQATDSLETGPASRPALVVAKVGNAELRDGETGLQRTIRLMKAPGVHRQLMELPGFEASLAAKSLAPSAATPVVQAQDRRSPWMPWWAWAIVGAGIATAATQLEFGDDDDDELDDDGS